MPGSVGAPLGGDPALAFNTGHSSGIEALEELGVHDVSEKRTTVVDDEKVDEKGATDDIQYVPVDEESFGIGKGMTASQKGSTPILCGKQHSDLIQWTIWKKLLFMRCMWMMILP